MAITDPRINALTAAYRRFAALQERGQRKIPKKAIFQDRVRDEKTNDPQFPRQIVILDAHGKRLRGVAPFQYRPTVTNWNTSRRKVPDHAPHSLGI